MKAWFKANRGFVLFLLGIGLLRTAVADWNPIPSGSMRPTLLEGDVVLVDRTAYDLKLPLTDVVLARRGEPRRGDVVTFLSPADGTRLIKRIVALPGDTLELRAGMLLVNGEAAQYRPTSQGREPVAPGFDLPVQRGSENLQGREHAVQFLGGFAARRDFGPVTVPAEHFFMLGDNRDNSADSRVIGFVPRTALIGRAHHVLVSADIGGNWLPRWERWASRLN